MSRVELAKIPALTFYKDTLTASRRTSPVPQLVCQGAPCKLFQPEVVRCERLDGAVGTDVDWKCQADLPEALRFGRVQVSCEGYTKPGDPYVLKGSCSLEYRLVRIPDGLRNPDSTPEIKKYTYLDALFVFAFVGILFFLVYSFVLSCMEDRNGRRTGSSSSRRGGGGGGGGSGWSPGGGGTNAPPPPYSKNPETSSSNSSWRPGFWSGAATGSAATQLYNNMSSGAQSQPTYQPTYQPPTQRSSYRNYDNDDRGEGSSNLGAMRSSTGFGGSSVR